MQVTIARIQMDIYLEIPDDNISEPGLSEEELYQYEQGMFEPLDYSYDEEQNADAEEDNPLISVERNESLKRKSKLVNGKGCLYIQEKKASKNAPVMKGPIILGNKHYVLSGWIRSGRNNTSRYISILVSELEIDLEGNKSYKKRGTGFLRFSKQTAPKQPSYRGEIKIGNDFYSLSAWKASSRGKNILSINSHSIETSSYSDVQNDLKKWSSATSK